MKQQDQNRIVSLQNNMRDLLGFVRMENAVLMDQGRLTLRGLYLQKMILLKDLEEQAEDLAHERSDIDIAECLILLSQVQKELKVNTVHHLEALKNKSAHLRDDDLSDLFEGQIEQEGGWA